MEIWELEPDEKFWRNYNFPKDYYIVKKENCKKIVVRKGLESLLETFKNYLDSLGYQTSEVSETRMFYKKIE